MSENREALPRMTVETQDAKALYAALNELTEALAHVDIKGARAAVNRVNEACDEAEVILQSMDGDYAG